MPRGVSAYDEAALQQRLWTPGHLRGTNNLRAWLDASDQGTLTLSGSNITNWADKSGFGRNMTGVNSPTYANNTVSVTNGSTQQFSIVSLGSATFSCMLVGTPAAAGGHRALLSAAAGHNPLDINTGATTLGVLVASTFTQAGTLTWPVQFGMAGVVIASSTLFAINRDGGTQANVTPASMTLSPNPIVLNVLAGGAGWGSVNELIFVTSATPNWMLQRMEGYLAWKWQALGRRFGNLVTLLPASHPYKNRPPLV